MNTVYFAKHILLENGAILQNGAVSVCDGVIFDVGPRGAVARVRDERIVNLGDMLLLPGFINMHTHLEEAPIRGFRKEPDETFAAWSAKKYSRMRQLTPEQITAGIQLYAREMMSQGITTIVDSTRTGFSAGVLAGEPVRAVIIREIADKEFAKEGINQVQEWLDGDGGAFKYGVGPHAIYSMKPRGHRSLIEYSYDSGCLWACHLAESAEELQAFCEHSGDFYFNQTRMRPWPAGRSRLSPVQYALTENLIPSFAVLFHCNYINSYELQLLAAKRAFVTLCYRYCREMNHKRFPVEVACNRGIRLCLGTEGTMPAGEVSLLEELFHLKMAYPLISAAEMLNWVTQNPAAALRASDKLGSITPGKYADIIGVRFTYDAGEDILETMLVSDPEVAFSMVGGEEVIVDI
jgi:5-methylthioadenosine/S-adenosylhomocysteine deaminase